MGFFYLWAIAMAQVTVNIQLNFLYNSRSVEERPDGPRCNEIQTIVLKQKPASPRVKTWPRWNLREPAEATLGNHFAPPPNCRARRQREWELEKERADKMPVGCLSAGRHVDSTLYIREEETEPAHHKSQVDFCKKNALFMFAWSKKLNLEMGLIIK